LRLAKLGTPAFDYTIEPPGRFIRVDWKELWRYRDLFLVIAWRDISIRYKQTALGVIWAALQPFVSMVVFTFIFNRLAKVGSGDDTPYPVFVLVGLILWQYYSGTITRASESLVMNAQMIQKIYFPRLIMPVASAVAGLVDLAIATLILLAMMAAYGFAPHWQGIAILPVLLFSTVCSSLGVGFFLAALNVKYRDVRYALPFVIQTLMYVTPVMYPVSMLNKYPVVKTLMIWLNPISGVISNARAGLLGRSPIEWGVLGVSCLMSFVFLLVGLAYFKATEAYFADIV
jgi:lipopolysaccharide transport system permease protein